MPMYTLEEARAMLPRVQAITEESHAQVEVLREELEAATDAVVRRRLEQRLNATVQDWARRLMRLGVEVKGLWVADWDSGDGYYWCWQLGEETVEYFHRYEDGFAGRKPTKNLMGR